MSNKKGFILSTYVYMLLVFFLLLLTTMLAVMNNSKLLSNKLKEQTNNTSGLIDKDFSFVLLGESDMVIKKGEEYIEPGFKIQTSKKKDLSDIVNITGNVDVNNPNTYKLTYSATYNGITKKLTRNVTVLDNIASNYITKLYDDKSFDNGLINQKIKYETKEYDTGIRYSGVNPKNYVYFNCDDKDNNIVYGTEGYSYDTLCEKWRIIGVFDVSNGTTTEKRVKLINTASTFEASWDSSASSVNGGFGVTQWGESGSYEGADLMQLLNGYYIGKIGSQCKYCNGKTQSVCSQICTAEELKTANMKVLTTSTLQMIENAVWDINAVYGELYPVTSSNVRIAYLQEKGISAQYTGKSECPSSNTNCNDKVTRTPTWTGLIGLMSVGDIGYANGWLYGQENLIYPWSISARTHSTNAIYVWISGDDGVGYYHMDEPYGVWPSLYLKSTVKIISGDGTEDNPYKLSI